MNYTRVIPVILLKNGGLYKTVKFKNPKYVGDPINTVKIFNEKEADELLLLDFNASAENRKPDFTKIAEIAGEAFMPMAYGGGIKSLDDAKKVFDCGFEKVVLSSILYEDASLINEIATIYGAQSVVGCIDVKKNFLGKKKVYTHSGSKNINKQPVDWAQYLEEKGIGEIIINNIDKDGLWSGYDLELVNQISSNVSVPVIACGGAGMFKDFQEAVSAGASAVAAGSMFVFQKKGMGVLISFPTGIKV